MVCYVSRVIFRRERRMVWLERSWYDFGQCERSRVSEGGFDASRAQKPNWTNFSRATPKSNWSNISRAAKPNYTNISRVTKPYHLCMSRVTKSYHLSMSRVTKPYYLNTSRVTKPYHLCISWVAHQAIPMSLEYQNLIFQIITSDMITPKTRTPGGVGTLRHVTMLLGARSNTTLLILSVKGWGGTPQIRYHLFAKNFVRKGGGGTPHIRNLFFLTKNRCFLGKKHHF